MSKSHLGLEDFGRDSSSVCHSCFEITTRTTLAQFVNYTLKTRFQKGGYDPQLPLRAPLLSAQGHFPDCNLNTDHMAEWIAWLPHARSIRFSITKTMWKASQRVRLLHRWEWHLRGFPISQWDKRRQLLSEVVTPHPLLPLEKVSTEATHGEPSQQLTKA